MKKVLIAVLVLVAFTWAYAQEGKVVRAGEGSVVVVEKLPITLVVNGDTLVMDGEQGPLHLIMRKKGEHSCAHVTTEKKRVWTTVISGDEDIKDEKVIKLRLKEVDEDKPDGKNMHVELETIDEDGEMHEKDGKVIVITKKLKGDDEEHQIHLTLDDKKIKPIIGLGILLEDQKDKLLVSKIMDKSEIKEQPFKVNDRIVQIEGQDVKTSEEFFKIYKPIEVGKTVKVKVERDKKMVDLSFAKPKEKGKMMIIECEK